MNKRDSIYARIAYGVGDIYGGGSFLIVGVLLMSYLTNVEGLSGTVAGVILFIGKAWDAVTDPIMGVLSDRTGSPLGRRRVYFLFGSIPVVLSWVMLWYSFGIPEGTARAIYYVFSFIFFSTAFTIVMVPYNSILTEMTNDYDKRSAFTGMRLSISAGAAIICAIVPAMITGSFENQKTGYLVMALVFGIVFGISWLIVFSGTWENMNRSESRDFSMQGWLSVFKNRSFRLYAGIFITSQMAIDVTMALAVYYIAVSIRRQELFIPAMAAILIIQLVFMMVFSALAQRFGKKMPAIISSIVWIIANVLIFFLSPKTPDAVIITVCSLIGVGAAGCNLVSWSILPDITDVDELMTGKRREGLYSGVSTFLRKLSSGVAVGSIGLMLDAFKYSEDAVKSGNIDPLTDIGVRIMFCAIPVFFLILMLIILRKYKLGKREFVLMQQVLADFRSNGTAVEIDTHSVLVCEQLTGSKAESLFGK